MLMTLCLPHMALFHWQPTSHQHIIEFWVNPFKTQNKLIFYPTT